MLDKVSKVPIYATPLLEESFRRPYEAVHFAELCRQLWPVGAAKKLEDVLVRNGYREPGDEATQRSCRAWVASSYEPAADVWFVLMRDEEVGEDTLHFLQRKNVSAYWQKIMRDQRVADQIDNLRLD